MLAPVPSTEFKVAGCLLQLRGNENWTKLPDSNYRLAQRKERSTQYGLWSGQKSFGYSWFWVSSQLACISIGAGLSPPASHR